ncbi:MAG: hypothetical protein LBH43_14565 [Treponema sp.]|nr:hypothetical protein [Treponema sp.]
MNLRTIGKAGFLVVFFGFFMPWGRFSGLAALLGQMNGFDFASLLMNYGNSSLAMLIYLWFAAAIAGIVIGILLLIKKSIRVFIDWIPAILCFIGSIYLFFVDPPGILLSGAYLVFIGSIVAIVVQIVSIIKKER